MLKKAILLSFIFISLIVDSFGQKRTTEIGLFLGRSYYIGELNPETHVGNGVGSLTFGGAFRYNLNKRYSLKATLIRTNLKAKDESTGLSFNNQRNATLESKITEFAASVEFNFLPFKAGVKGQKFTPYLFVGVSYYNYDPNVTVNGYSPQPIDESGGSKLALPFGPGLKLSLGNRTTLAFEWGFRKTSNDLIDGLENRIDDIFETGKSYDNDWFVVSGFMLTYKLTNEGSCPGYNF